MKELNQGQVSNIHLRESFLTHITRAFSFVGENPCEAECIWGITPIFWERLKSYKFFSQANKHKFFKRIWNNLYGLMAEEILSQILDWNTECLNFSLWQLWQMWLEFRRVLFRSLIVISWNLSILYFNLRYVIIFLLP